MGPGTDGGGSRRSSGAGAGYPWDSAPSSDPSSGPPSRRSPGPSPDLSAGVELGGEGAFGGSRRQWLQAFDPGRPGVRAMAAVAVVVVLVAAFLAWRSRPRVDPIAAGSVSVAPSPGPGHGPGAGAEIVVAVGGKVRKPGLVRLAPGARVADALTAAGGAEPGVDVAMLNLARKVVDGELIMVGAAAPSGQSAPGASGGLVNLNTATLAELDTLPGVGPVLAQRILDARDAQGGFRGISDLRKVEGIGDSRYEQLKELVTV
ncbi:ComEA family DNA-binding protein [Actinoplanes sp. NPDC023801]|uniref:ComEA family DNA-binding protein n=1 Tax=Actinoplanes sp. NPDC023801 TaxID=3154595 RepID=UPI0033F55F48